MRFAPRIEVKGMRVIANVTLCQGHSRCADICPEVFGTDAILGKVVLRLQEIPPSLDEDVMVAVNNCPEGALAVQGE
jgi:ferredoxin